MPAVPETSRTTPSDADIPTLNKQDPGRGAAVIVYWLLLGSIMAVITAPIGALVAHLKYRQAAPWVQSHLQFQLRTFWLGVLAGAVFAAVWQLLGMVGVSPLGPWAMGYAFFTACFIWLIGRCGVGAARLMTNRPIPNPKSPAFGGRDAAPADS
ncbi:hypothetical protein GCM10022228_14920 [Halomonas cibimaris]|uniref:Transmembrane protein n=1 Tax=Halomonas cibimaris TaxID=657012 RepID=A0ABP7LNW3_9GAMM